MIQNIINFLSLSQIPNIIIVSYPSPYLFQPPHITSHQPTSPHHQKISLSLHQIHLIHLPTLFLPSNPTLNTSNRHLLSSIYHHHHLYHPYLSKSKLNQPYLHKILPFTLIPAIHHQCKLSHHLTLHIGLSLEPYPFKTTFLPLYKYPCSSISLLI